MNKLISTIICALIMLSFCGCKKTSDSVSSISTYSSLNTTSLESLDSNNNDVSTTISETVSSIDSPVEVTHSSVKENQTQPEQPQSQQQQLQEQQPQFELYDYVPNNSNHTNYEYENTLFNHINKSRIELGVKPLLWNETLYEYSKKRCEELLLNPSTKRADGFSDGETIYMDCGFQPTYLHEYISASMMINDMNDQIIRTEANFTGKIEKNNYYSITKVSPDYTSMSLATIIDPNDTSPKPYLNYAIVFWG